MSYLTFSDKFYLQQQYTLFNASLHLTEIAKMYLNLDYMM